MKSQASTTLVQEELSRIELNGSSPQFGIRRQNGCIKRNITCGSVIRLLRGAVLLESVYDSRTIAPPGTKRKQDGSRF
jgi:hypothetical protein